MAVERDPVEDRRFEVAVREARRFGDEVLDGIDRGRVFPMRQPVTNLGQTRAVTPSRFQLAREAGKFGVVPSQPTARPEGQRVAS